MSKEELVDENLLELAETILGFFQIDRNKFYVTPAFYLTVGPESWVKGITIIVAGALLFRYPPPVRTAGIWLIK